MNGAGILQNPTGWHEGRRVWGGGIVKYKTPHEWLPWPIDLVPDESLRPSGQAMHPALPLPFRAERKQTSKAYGENLTAISVIDLNPGEGNIHTGATPPWLVNSQPKPRPLVGLGTDIQGQPDSIPSSSMTLRQQLEALREQKRQAKRAKNPNRIGAAFREEQNARKKARALAAVKGDTVDEGRSSSGWMPSFGGVWNEGPRSQHAKQFQSLASQRPPQAYQSRRGSAATHLSSAPRGGCTAGIGGGSEIDVSVDEDFARWMASEKERIAIKLRMRGQGQQPPDRGSFS